MNQFTPKTFKIPTLKGISTKTIDEHLKLYAGYVKNANLVLEKIEELKMDGEKNSYLLGELHRRFSFEYNGVRNHEVYFGSLEVGASSIAENSDLKKLITETWGSFDSWLTYFKSVGLTRGIGWAALYYDHNDNRLFTTWIDEQHLGQLQGCSLILALDMWEHSYVSDYQPSGKKTYIEDFFINLNWHAVEDNFSKASKLVTII
jgi:Fe-Mn family superoxide dismutase